MSSTRFAGERHHHNTYSLAVRAPPYLKNPQFYKQLCDGLICSQTTFIFSGTFYSFMYGDYIWLLFGITMIVNKLMTHKLTEYEKNESAEQSNKDIKTV